MDGTMTVPHIQHKPYIMHFFFCHRGRDHMVAGYTTGHEIKANHQQSYKFKSCSWRGVLGTTSCDKICH